MTSMKTVALLAMLLAAGTPAHEAAEHARLGVAAPNDGPHRHEHDGHHHGQHETVLSALSEHEEFSTLAGLVRQAGLDDLLSGQGPWTVFAPLNSAFAALPEAVLERLTSPQHREELRRVLLGHIVKGKLAAAELNDAQVIETLAGTRLRVSRRGDRLEIGGGTFDEVDIPGGNGVVHAIEAVLLPEKEEK